MHGLTLIGPAVDVRAMELVCNNEHPNSEVVHKPVVRRGRRDASDWRSGGSNGLPAEQGPRIAGHPLAGQQLTLLVLPVDTMAQIRVIVSMTASRRAVPPKHGRPGGLVVYNGTIAPNQADEGLKQIATIVREGLEEYNVGFTFHVVVDRESNDFGDGDGEPYLDIAIICDANNVEELRVPDLVGYLMTLRDKLVESGVEEFPVPSFFLKSEWEGLTKSSGSR